MQRITRITISLDEELAAAFDEFIAARSYVNRSEAVRDLIRAQLGSQELGTHHAKWCIATVSYVYDHHDQPVSVRLMSLKHKHHDLVLSSLHTYLDHDHCLETVVLRGRTAAVEDCSAQLIALRGVRHGQVHLLPMTVGAGHDERTAHGENPRHKHLKPLN